MPFICQFCNDNQLYTDSLTESQPTVSILEVSQNTESLANTKDCDNVILTDNATESGITQTTYENDSTDN